MALLLANLPARSNAQNLDPTQVYTTPNIVQQTNAGSETTPWVNGVYQNNLTCWGWGDPGYCGPNAIVRPGGNINFSFGMTDLYQLQSIASVLPNTGSGLRVNGYNFGFTAKNGNGWDDGRTDYLLAYVSLYDSKGSLEYSKNYDLNYKFGWTNFNFSETFTSPFATKDLGNVRYGFLGMDNNYWAGPYGPEVYNVNFNLKFSVDPCSVDVLSSPSCPGYIDALNKITLSTSIASATNEPTTITPTIAIATASSIPAPATTTTEVVATTPVTTASTSGGSTTGTGTPSPTITAVASKVGEVTDSGKSSQPVSLSTILSIVSNEQSRIGNVERSVVQQAVDQAVKEAEKTQKDAEKIAGDSQQQSIAASMQALNTGAPQSSILSTATNVPGQGTGLTFFSPSQTNGIGLSASRLDLNNSESMLRQDSAISVGIIPGIANRGMSTDLAALSNRRTEEVELPKSEGFKVGERNQVLNLIEEKPQTSQQTTLQPQSGPTVNQRVADNDAAGNINLASIATQPRGYESYFSALPDVQFYAPKEIYKGQKTVDNARALRQLSSDTLHQRMIEQQYNRR